MRKIFVPALILAASALAGAGVAATAAAPGPGPMGPEATMADEGGPGGPGMRHFMMMRHEFSPTKHIDGRLAFLKAELKIKPAQENAWSDFESASRKSAAILEQSRPTGDQKAAGLAVPARLDLAEKRMTARLDALKTVKSPAKTLYDNLDDGQKKTADELFMRPMGFR